MEKAYEDIINNIKGFTNEVVYQTFYFEKLKKELLCVYLYGGAHTSILLYDDKHGIREVGEICYRANANSIFVSKFETNYDFQQCGLGRFMFNLAMAHGDSLGATTLYGYASPTDAIKGVSDKKGVTYNDEKLNLVKIYKGLGCVVSPDPTESEYVASDETNKSLSLKDIVTRKKTIDQTVKFEQTWNSGEKLNALPLDQKQFLHNVVLKQKSLRK